MLNKKGTILSIILLLLSSLSIVESQGTKFSDPQIARAALAVVRILVAVEGKEGIEQYGTGVIVSPEGVIFTAAHVVNVSDQPIITVQMDLEGTLNQPEEYNAKILYMSEDLNLDFAIIGIENPDNSMSFPTIGLWAEEISRGENLHFLGYVAKNGMDDIAYDQMISIIKFTDTVNFSQFAISSQNIAKGASGAPILSSDYKYIGIISGSNIPLDTDIPSAIQYNINYMSRLCELNLLVPQNNIDPCSYKPDASLAPTLSPPTPTLAPRVDPIGTRLPPPIVVAGGTEAVVHISRSTDTNNDWMLVKFVQDVDDLEFPITGRSISHDFFAANVDLERVDLTGYCFIYYGFGSNYPEYPDDCVIGEPALSVSDAFWKLKYLTVTITGGAAPKGEVTAVCPSGNAQIVC